MFQVDDGAVSTLPTIPVAGTPGWFTDGTPGVQEATPIDAWWLNMVQGELRAFLTAASIAPSKTNQGQVLASAQALFAAKADRRAPLSARSSQGILFGASYSGSVSVSFTPPVAGYVLAFGSLNLSAVASAGILANLSVGGVVVAGDSALLAQSHVAAAAVTAGTSVTVALAVTTTTSPATTGTYMVGAIFVPYP